MKNQDPFLLWFNMDSDHYDRFEIDLSKYNIDSAIDVYIKSDHTPWWSIYLSYNFNTNTDMLEIFLGHPYKINKNDKLFIKFYSKSQMRDKLLNELLDDAEQED